MPLINGQKMACEPCIRGHRSTKCTHASERLMVPVRKPGRPLSSCPHPASRPCSCAAVTAAIPRKQTCHCGPSAHLADMNGSDKEIDSSNGESSPPSPLKSKNTFKVQKQSKVGTGRKPSIDIAGIGRMNPNHINLLQIKDGLPPKVNGHPGQGTMLMPVVNPYNGGAPINFSNPLANELEVQYPVLQPSIHPDFIPAPSPEITSNGLRNSHSQPSSTSKSAKPAKGGCCGAALAEAQQSVPDTSGGIATSADETKAEVKSCCSVSSASAKRNTLPESAGEANLKQQVSELMMNPFLSNGAMTNSFPYLTQPTVFNYPPQYGSYLQPLQPEQWRQVMNAMIFGQAGQQQLASVPANTPVQAVAPPIPEAWTSHECGCGESCQCVGCAAHPYNTATQDYVRSAWNTMMTEPQKTKENGTSASKDNEMDHHTNPPTAVPGDSTSGLSPVPPQTPSDATSGLGEEQTLSENDFFFVSYPFTDSCEGDVGSCPCGDDCQCIGCAIHGNTEPEASASH